MMPRYTEPDADAALLLHQVKLTLPQQPPPRIGADSEDPLALQNVVQTSKIPSRPAAPQS